MTYTDQTPMPFGKHKGTKMANVPASYLLWLNEQGITHQGLKQYVEENIDAIKFEASNEKDRNRFNAK